TPPFDEYYDQASALYLPDLFGWLYDTQPEQLAKLVKPGGADRGHGAGVGDGTGGGVSNVLGEYAPAAERIRGRVVKLLSTGPMAGGGTLNVLKNAVDATPARLSLFQPRPATPLNPELDRRYGLNRLRVMRQVRYSAKNQNSIDLVLFLNGHPWPPSS
ncbi:MAG: hypothetical protein LBG60_04580, partial [Bifidobacteriaceae bacterium]|nr:hypothetical protein [Bifidobacteriaceae bacterium]